MDLLRGVCCGSTGRGRCLPSLASSTCSDPSHTPPPCSSSLGCQSCTPLLKQVYLLCCSHKLFGLETIFFRHAHPDMASLSRRLDSFPPDWAQISGSAGSASEIAEAGFFYSCRRLKSSEATCYSCGRQVSDWTGKTGIQAHRQISDHCPLYIQDKAGQEMPVEGERRSVSCFAEFFFIAATIVFRLGSFLLILAVFLPQWHQVPHLVIQNHKQLETRTHSDI